MAIIMDGNGRWAKQRGLPRIGGHRAGTENIRHVLRVLTERGVRYVTLYAFSTENWGRPTEEVQGLMGVLQEVIHREATRLHRENVRILHLGRTDRLAPSLQKAIADAVQLTANNTGVTLSVAFDYGGRAEIIEAVRRVVRDGVSLDDIDEDMFRRYLYTDGLPDPDLIIRTAGEQRLSNFLLWQSAYSEYYCTPVLWPDFDEQEIQRAIADFCQRKRRFGNLVAEG